MGRDYLSYQEKLKDPRWQKKRLKIFERDSWTCKYCSSKDKALHIHHLFYIPNEEPWETNEGFLLTICEDCHAAIREFSEDFVLGDTAILEIGQFLNFFWTGGFYPDDLHSLSYSLSKIKRPVGPAVEFKLSVKKWKMPKHKSN